MKKKIAVILAALLCCVAMLSGCSSSSEPVDLTISAAASLKNVMEELTTKFNESEPNITLTFNYGSSGDLQKQIENGVVGAYKKIEDGFVDRFLEEVETESEINTAEAEATDRAE